MTARYIRELNALEQVYSAARSVNINEIVRIVESQFETSLIAIGSGGSFSAASFVAQLHERMTGHLSRASTPLAYLEGSTPSAAILCLSARGRNRDIRAAFKAAAMAERGPVSALVMVNKTPLHTLATKYSSADIATVYDASFKDGFLAVATLLASSVILTRAYADVTSTSMQLPSHLRDLEHETLGELRFKAIPEIVANIMAKPTVSVLFSPLLSATATDLESRFVEAALGNLHVSDFRNFGHGRHHWVAKRESETGIVALVSDADSELANRTFSLLPDTLEKCRIGLHGHETSQMVSSLIVGLYLSLAAGKVAGIDPGKPGVPLFGRKLYALGPRTATNPPTAINQRIAIYRKCGHIASFDHADNERWVAAYKRVLTRFSKTKFGGVIFDYDDTLCSNEDRFKPLSANVASALERLLDLGLHIGIATGRGPSAGEAMRASLQQKFWDVIVIGYYNGNIVTHLSDESDPIAKNLSPDLLNRFSDDPVFSSAKIRGNSAQITIRLSGGLPTSEAIDRARQIMASTEEQAHVTTSGHSIDIVLGGAPKHNVVEAVSRMSQGLECLRIGDQGRWPGNDAYMLDHPLGLSVNIVNSHLDHCWNLSPAGVRGVDAALFYMSCLSRKGTSIRFILRASRRGVTNEA